MDPILFVTLLTQESRKLCAVMHSVQFHLRHYFPLTGLVITKAQRDDFVPIFLISAIQKLAQLLRRSFTDPEQLIDRGMRQRLEIWWSQPPPFIVTPRF